MSESIKDLEAKLQLAKEEEAKKAFERLKAVTSETGYYMDQRSGIAYFWHRDLKKEIEESDIAGCYSIPTLLGYYMISHKGGTEIVKVKDCTSFASDCKFESISEAHFQRVAEECEEIMAELMKKIAKFVKPLSPEFSFSIEIARVNSSDLPGGDYINPQEEVISKDPEDCRWSAISYGVSCVHEYQDTVDYFNDYWAGLNLKEFLEDFVDDKKVFWESMEKEVHEGVCLIQLEFKLGASHHNEDGTTLWFVSEEERQELTKGDLEP